MPLIYPMAWIPQGVALDAFGGICIHHIWGLWRPGDPELRFSSTRPRSWPIYVVILLLSLHPTAMQSTDHDSIYHLAATGFKELGVSDPHTMTHRILLRDRFFVGHRFECEGLEAVYRMEEGRAEFYGPDGRLLKTVTWGQDATRKAA